jgi:hypothetical protein
MKQAVERDRKQNSAMQNKVDKKKNLNDKQA